MSTCPVCHGTGESGQYGMLDCAHPGCNAATERAKFQEYMKSLGPLTEYDRDWAAYRFGRVYQQLVDSERLPPTLKPQADVLRKRPQPQPPSEPASTFRIGITAEELEKRAKDIAAGKIPF